MRNRRSERRAISAEILRCCWPNRDAAASSQPTNGPQHTQKQSADACGSTKKKAATHISTRHRLVNAAVAFASLLPLLPLLPTVTATSLPPRRLAGRRPRHLHARAQLNARAIAATTANANRKKVGHSRKKTRRAESSPLKNLFVRKKKRRQWRFSSIVARERRRAVPAGGGGGDERASERRSAASGSEAFFCSSGGERLPICARFFPARASSVRVLILLLVKAAAATTAAAASTSAIVVAAVRNVRVVRSLARLLNVDRANETPPPPPHRLNVGHASCQLSLTKKTDGRSLTRPTAAVARRTSERRRTGRTKNRFAPPSGDRIFLFLLTLAASWRSQRQRQRQRPPPIKKRCERRSVFLRPLAAALYEPSLAAIFFSRARAYERFFVVEHAHFASTIRKRNTPEKKRTRSLLYEFSIRWQANEAKSGNTIFDGWRRPQNRTIRERCKSVDDAARAGRSLAINTIRLYAAANLESPLKAARRSFASWMRRRLS